MRGLIFLGGIHFPEIVTLAFVVHKFYNVTRSQWRDERRNTMIYVIATVELINGRSKEYLNEFNNVSSHVRAEAGCLQYCAAKDKKTGIQVQEPINENTVTIIERWTDIDALKAHISAPHMATYREAVKNYVKRVTIRVLEPLDH